jgi:hypothetical protein
MALHLSASFDVKSWDETPFDHKDTLPKATRAVVTKDYSGDIDGTSTTQWLMAYGEDGSATFVGLERISGSFEGRIGTLVLEHAGTYGDGEARGQVAVIEGSGTEDLTSAKGEGTFLADPAGSVHLDLTVD